MSPDLPPAENFDEKAMERFSKALSDFRNRHAPGYRILGRKALAELIGVDEHTVERWETNNAKERAKHRPPRELVLRIGENLQLGPKEQNDLLKTLDYYPEYPEEEIDHAVSSPAMLRRLLVRAELTSGEHRSIEEYIRKFCALWDRYAKATSPNRTECLQAIAKHSQDYSRAIESQSQSEAAQAELQAGRLESAINSQRKAVDLEPDRDKRINKLLILGDMQRQNGLADPALQSYTKARQSVSEILAENLTPRERGEKEEFLGQCFRKIGSVYLFIKGNAKLALEQYEKAEPLSRNNQREMCKLLYQQAWAYYMRNLGRDRDRSKESRQRGLDLARDLNDPTLLALGYRLEGDEYRAQEALSEAEGSYRTALKYAREISDNYEKELEAAKILRGLGLAVAPTSPEQAKALLGDSEGKLKEPGVIEPLHLGLTLLYAGEFLLNRDNTRDLELAKEKLAEAQDLFEKMGNSYYNSSAHVWLAEIYWQQQALQQAEAAAIVFQKIDLTRQQAAKPETARAWLGSFAPGRR